MAVAADASALHPCAEPDPDTRSPRHRPPPLSCDCHAHVFWPAGRYPLSPTREFDPPLCSVAEYVCMLDILGIERTVIVHPSAYGTDNRASTDAIAAIGLNRARGIAVIAGTESDEQLRSLDNAGMRGVRLSSAVKGGVGLDRLDEIAERIAPLGWHIDLHLGNVSELTALAPRLSQMAVPIVIDHLGRVTAKDGIDSAGFQSLLGLLRRSDHIWAKLSSFYRLTKSTAPFTDMLPMARALVAARDDRLVWGSNWPHVHFHGQMPNDTDLLDVLSDWASPESRQKILVDNPAELYGFGL